MDAEQQQVVGQPLVRVGAIKAGNIFPNPPPPLKRKRGRPKGSRTKPKLDQAEPVVVRKPIPPPPPPKKIPEPPPEPLEAMAYRQGFTDGMRFFLVKFSNVVVDDPVALTSALVAIRLADKGHNPPRRANVPWSTKSVFWREEAALIEKRFGRSVDEGAEAAIRPKPGRPRKNDTYTDWT